ncbi:TetR/AcrR family transcriptional regulator [Streptomyces sp. NPDC048179]|uniref:TetR/AcrR family transcriptional regulator n=1 Tax=Streptomyces sp. NPDC048179 TaxID=3365506 RepID=UPI00372377F0
MTRTGGSRQRHGLRRTEQILEAAEELVAAVGVAAVAMNALARHAGVSPGTLYQYFPHKRAVVDALLRRLAAELPVRTVRDGQTDPAPEAAVGEMLEEVAALAERRPALLPLMRGAEPQDEPNVLLRTLSASLAGIPGCADEADEFTARIVVQGVTVALRCADPDARAKVLARTREAILAGSVVRDGRRRRAIA